MTIYLLGPIVAALVCFVALALISHFTPDVTKDRILYEDFKKNGLPKIWAKTGITDSIWSQLECPKDGSKMYVTVGEWHQMFYSEIASTNVHYVCPTCGTEFWHECDAVGLNTFRPLNPGT